MRFYLGALLFFPLWAGAVEASEHSIPMAVLVEYRLNEASVDLIQVAVSDPLMQALSKVPRVTVLIGTTNHWRADMEIQFDGGATPADLATVVSALEHVNFGEITVTARMANLAPVRPSFSD